MAEGADCRGHEKLCLFWPHTIDRSKIFINFMNLPLGLKKENCISSLEIESGELIICEPDIASIINIYFTYI